MTKFVALLSGFLLTLGVFGGGALTAVFFVNANPVPARALDGDTGALWTNEAVRLTANDQHLERLPARLAPEDVNEVGQGQDRAPHADPGAARKPAPDRIAAASSSESAPQPVTDPTTTAATSPETEPQPAAAMNSAHVEWCLRHYRSYDPADDSYNSYSGVRRECVSPYSDGASDADPSVASDEEGIDASEERDPAFESAAVQEVSGGYLSPEHVQSCFDRYRSYRPEDNSYQPYGGGPRQQCE